MVRFHGRDPEAWTKKTVQERFRYHYKPEELQEWVPRIEHLAENAEQVQVLMNNCYADDAVVGARDLTARTGPPARQEAALDYEVFVSCMSIQCRQEERPLTAPTLRPW